MHYIPILSTIVTFTFAIAVFNRYRHKRGPYLFLWGIGLVFYGLGTLTEVFLGFGFSALALKLWYLSGAMLTAAWLGQGTVQLLVRRRGVAPLLTIILSAVSAIAFVMVLAAPITGAAAGFDPAQPVSTQYKDILVRTGPMIALTIILNVYGTLGLVGGAIYSSFLFWRKKVLANRMFGNLLIAAGALLPAMAGSFVKAGLFDWLYLSELFGAILMYTGFIKATSNPVTENQPVVQAAAD